MWLEVLILMNSSSSAELQRSSNVCASGLIPRQCPQARPNSSTQNSINNLHNTWTSVSVINLYYCFITSVGTQCRLQTDTSIFSVWARHTDVAGPALAAVSGTHWLQAGCARLSMPARSGDTEWYLSDHIQCVADSNSHHLQSSFSLQLVIRRIHGCPLSAIVRFRWLEAASGTVCHPSSHQLPRFLFCGTAPRLTLFQIISLITVFCICFCTPWFSSLAF